MDFVSVHTQQKEKNLVNCSSYF